MSYDYSSQRARVDFAVRLHEICDDKKIPSHGRQTALGKLLGLSQRGVKRWFDGDAFPALDKAVQIAAWAGVNFEWLMTGRGPKPLESNATQDQINLALMITEMAKEPRQQILDFIQYKIERSDAPFASDKAAHYVAMIEKIKADMAEKKNGEQAE